MPRLCSHQHPLSSGQSRLAERRLMFINAKGSHPGSPCDTGFQRWSKGASPGTAPRPGLPFSCRGAAKLSVSIVEAIIDKHQRACYSKPMVSASTIRAAMMRSRQTNTIQIATRAAEHSRNNGNGPTRANILHLDWNADDATNLERRASVQQTLSAACLQVIGNAGSCWRPAAFDRQVFCGQRCGSSW